MAPAFTPPPADERLLPNFSQLCRETFGVEMKLLREEGQRQNLSTEAICIAIIVAAIHIQAMAIVGGDIDLKDFDDLLESDIQNIRDRMAEKRMGRR